MKKGGSTQSFILAKKEAKEAEFATKKEAENET